MYVCPECGGPDEAAGSCPSDGAALVFTTDDLSGMTIGPYRVATVIGAGGTGQVYRAVHPEIGSRVAIKVLAKVFSSDPQSLERFFAEARAVNLIRHENIVNILDLDRLPDGRPYIVMELIEGQPLSRWARSFDQAPLVPLARVACDVLAALEATHDKSIVHRDLKPHNILVTPEGRGKVLDFGVAKLKPNTPGGSGLTESGVLVGTPAYMAPEQALQLEVDARTDIYAMGVVLFECATGQRPFAADSLMEMLRKHAYEPPPRPCSLRADIPFAYERVILRALAKPPEDRWPSARAMRNALEQAVESSDATTPPTVKGKSLAVSPAAPEPTQRKSPLRTWLLVAVAAAAAAAGGAALVAGFTRSAATPVAASPDAAPSPRLSATHPAARGAIATPPLPVAPDAAPPAPAPRAAKKPSGHSVTGYLKRAHVRARETFGDAELVGIRAVGVGSNGRVDFSADTSYLVQYRFASMSRAKPAMATVRDVRARSRCLVWVTASHTGVSAGVVADSCSELAVIAAPACTAGSVWRKASATLGLKKTDVATLLYGGTLHASSRRWVVSGGGGKTAVNDACD